MQDLSQMSTEELLRMRNAAQQGQPAAQPPQSRAPGVIRGPQREPEPVDPYKVERDNRSDFADTRDTVASLRQEFRKLPTYDRYIVALSAFNSSLSTQANPQGDQSLITSYAKMLDPTSAVREGEFATTSQTENTINQIRARIAKEFGFSEGGMLTPEGRNFIRNEMYNLVENRFRKDYERDRGDFTSIAQSYGYSPELVVGSDPMATYQEAIDEFLQSREPKAATARDEAPLGYETGFDKFGRDESFDRAQALTDRFGVTPGKETRLVGLLNANRGNPNLTIEDLARIYETAGVPTPDEAGMRDLLEQMQRNTLPASAIDTSALKNEYNAAQDAVLASMGEDPNSDTAALTYGAARGTTLSLNDEITGIGAAIGGAFSGQNPIESYQVYRDLVRRQTERTREESPYLSYGGEIAGALLTGGRGFGGVNTVKDAAKVGAIEGGIYGFGEGEGAAGSALGAGVGGLTGGTVGAGVQRGLNALAARQATRAAQAAPVVEAAQRRGLTENIRGADIDPNLRGPRAQLMQGQNRETLRGVERDDLDAMQDALMRELGGVNASNAGGNQARGDAIQSGANAVVDRTRKQAGMLYDKARAKSGNIRVEPRQALRVINEQIAKLEEAGRNANRGSIEFLEGLRGDLGRSGGVGIDTLRGQRTNLRGNISASNLSLTDTERRATIVLDALSQDIRIGLQGNPALGEFRRADDLWRQQAEFQKEIIRKLVGTDANPVPAETAARRVQAFIKGDYGRAKSLLDAIGPEGRAAVREQVAVNLGRSQNGDFSPALFLKHTGDGAGSQLPQKSLVLLFGKDGAKAVQDLRTIAKAKVDAGSATNFSNTGGIVQRGMSGLRRLLLGGAGFGIAVDAGGGLGVGSLAAAGTALGGEIVANLGERRTMRLLLNPDFTKWLRNAPNTTDPRAIDRAFQSLRSTASKSPLFAADVNALEQALIGYANDNARKLAAEPSGTDQPEE